jgi:O-succinylbenzoate synthase
VRTGHGPWVEREGVIVRLEPADPAADPSATPRFALGEAAPVPSFGMESVDDLVAACTSLGEWVTAERLATVPATLPTLRNAITSALELLTHAERRESATANPPAATRPALGTAALLPAGRAALTSIAPKADAGFRIFKWKVGVGDVADELALLDDLCAALPTGGKLRLDANGAWDRRHAERWLERCADRPVEFVEQPVLAPPNATERERRKTDDVLLGLAHDYPTPLALDESLVADADAAQWLDAGWPGLFVVKPILFGDLAATLARLERAHADIVFSSALETAVGAQAALRTAFAWHARQPNPLPRPPRALGFGVWPLFADSAFDGPYAAPFIRPEDVERIEVTRVWSALA